MEEIYHEKQRLQFCLLHALNNLFQEKDSFTRADLNEIADKLVLIDPINNENRRRGFIPIFKPHHNAITGNYDVNVLIAALKEKGKTVVWHDRRSGAASIDLNNNNNNNRSEDDDDLLMGIVLNIPIKKFGGLWRSRHWVALRRIQGGRNWYNLDSELTAPHPFKDTDQLVEYLDLIINGGGEVLLIMHQKQLPEPPEVVVVSQESGSLGSYRGLSIRKMSKEEEERIGVLGEVMLGMLPDDLAFTVFVPSVEAFKRDLKLLVNDSLVKQEKDDNTYATLSRILGFSAVPRSLFSINVPLGKEVTYDSISGFKLYVWRDSDGILTVNGIPSKRVDIRNKEMVVHIMNGVIMDSEFEQSVPDDNEIEN